MLVPQRDLGRPFLGRIDRRHERLQDFTGFFAVSAGISFKALLQPSGLAYQVGQASEAPIVLAVDPIAIAHQPVGELLAEHADNHLLRAPAHHEQARRGRGWSSDNTPGFPPHEARSNRTTAPDRRSGPRRRRTHRLAGFPAALCGEGSPRKLCVRFEAWTKITAFAQKRVASRMALI